MNMPSLAYRRTLLRSVEFLQSLHNIVSHDRMKQLRTVESQLLLCQALFLTTDELTAAFDSGRPQDVEKKLNLLMRQTKEIRSQFSSDLMTGHETKVGEQLTLQIVPVGDE